MLENFVRRGQTRGKLMMMLLLCLLRTIYHGKVIARTEMGLLNIKAIIVFSFRMVYNFTLKIEAMSCP